MDLLEILKSEFSDFASGEEFARVVLRMLCAVALGGLVGLERERAGKAAGLRTHAVIGLLGGISGAIGLEAGAIALAALTLAFIAPFLAFKLRETEGDDDVSVTGTIAGLLVFALGVYCVLGDLRVAAARSTARW